MSVLNPWYLVIRAALVIPVLRLCTVIVALMCPVSPARYTLVYVIFVYLWSLLALHRCSFRYLSNIPPSG